MAILYGAQGTNATTSNLYTIDSTTGAPTSIGPIGFALTGLAFDPTDGTLYGVTSNNSASNPHSLITVDPITGSGTLIGNLNLGGASSRDLAITSDGQLWGISSFTENLLTINKITGSATDLGNPNFFGTLDPFSDDSFLSLDKTVTSGSFEHIAQDGTDFFIISPANNIPGPGSVFLGAASFGPDSLYWAVQTNSTGTLNLVTADFTTGNLVLIGATLSKIDALAWDTQVRPSAPIGPPVNDDLDFPIDVARFAMGGCDSTSHIDAATTQVGETFGPFASAPTIWYRWEVPNLDEFDAVPLIQVNFNIDQSPLTDKRLVLYGTNSFFPGFGSLTQLASAESGTGGINFTFANDGSNWYPFYLIQVIDKNSTGGNITFQVISVKAGPTPPNDDIANATVLTGDFWGPVTADLTGAHNQCDEHLYLPDVLNHQIYDDVWFKWVAPRTQRIEVDLWDFVDPSFSFIAWITVWRGTNLSALTDMTVDGVYGLVDGGDTGQYKSYFTFQAVEGTTYYLQCFIDSGGTGSFQLAGTMMSAVPPPNDDFNGAIVIQPGTGSFVAITNGATYQTGEYAGGFRDSTDMSSVWYELNVYPYGGMINLTFHTVDPDNDSSGGDVFVEILQGSTVSFFSMVNQANARSGDISVSLSGILDPEKHYYIRVATNGAWDDLHVTYTLGKNSGPIEGDGNYDAYYGGAFWDGQELIVAGAGSYATKNIPAGYNPRGVYIRFIVRHISGSHLWRGVDPGTGGDNTEPISLIRGIGTDSSTLFEFLLRGNNQGQNFLQFRDWDGNETQDINLDLGEDHRSNTGDTRVEMLLAAPNPGGFSNTVVEVCINGRYTMTSRLTNRFDIPPEIDHLDVGFFRYPATDSVPPPDGWSMAFSGVTFSDQLANGPLGPKDPQDAKKEITFFHSYEYGYRYVAPNGTLEGNFVSSGGAVPAVVASPDADGYALDCSTSGTTAMRGSVFGSFGTDSGYTPDTLLPGFGFEFYLTQLPDKVTSIGYMSAPGMHHTGNGVGLIEINPSGQIGVLFEPTNNASKIQYFCTVDTGRWHRIEFQFDFTGIISKINIWFDGINFGWFSDNSGVRNPEGSTNWGGSIGYSFHIGKLPWYAAFDASLMASNIGIYFRNINATRLKQARPLGPYKSVIILPSGIGQHNAPSTEDLGDPPVSYDDNGDFTGGTDACGQPLGYARYVAFPSDSPDHYPDPTCQTGPGGVGVVPIGNISSLIVVTDGSGPPEIAGNLAMSATIKNGSPGNSYINNVNPVFMSENDVMVVEFWAKGPPGAICQVSDIFASPGGGVWFKFREFNPVCTGDWQKYRCHFFACTIGFGTYGFYFNIHLQGNAGNTFLIKRLRVWNTPPEASNFRTTSNSGVTTSNIYQGTDTNSYSFINDFPIPPGGTNPTWVLLDNTTALATVNAGDEDATHNLPADCDGRYLEWTLDDIANDPIFARILSQWHGTSGNDTVFTSGTIRFETANPGEGVNTFAGQISNGSSTSTRSITLPVAPGASKWTLARLNALRIRTGFHNRIGNDGVQWSTNAAEDAALEALAIEAVVPKPEVPNAKCTGPVSFSHVKSGQKRAGLQIR